jgi:hypothetical protein
MTHDDKKWHLDKKVPIALIATIAIQTGAFIWWAASLSERVNTLERDALRSAPYAERIVRLETKMESIADGIIDIKRLLQAKQQ